MNIQTMDANEFIAKLKANNTAEDIRDLVKVFDDYKLILGKLPPKDRAPFSLNVLCVLCRNLDKAPKWRDTIDNKALLVLSIDCVRETRGMEKADRVKTLACIYHIHRHVVRQSSPIPVELILKISFMPFELEAKHLLVGYSKTYWNILVDRLSYIERYRNKIAIIKLLPKLTEDILKVIEIYDTVQFCNSIFVYLITKLQFLYMEKYAKELNQIYAQIFEKLLTKDVKPFKKLSDKETMVIYVKLNQCLYVVAENSSKTNFKDSPLNDAVQTCISIVRHSPDLFHCLQTFYLNSFCILLRTNTHLTYRETVLNGLLVSLETTEKLGYVQAMMATYPYLSQFLRLYIEYNTTNSSKNPWKDNFNVPIQESCLKLMQVLMRRLKNCDQLLKCDNCQVKSGLHDSFRLSFLVKHFMTVSLSQNIVITEILPLILDVIDNQYKIMEDLNVLGCFNYKKCFKKLQTDIHNTAISLNKAQYYEFSIKLFDIYLKNEINTSLTEQKNIGRGLYNKSICELDCKLYESALIDAFLSLVFATEGLSSEKYMSLVMDIKAKELKDKTDGNVETMQLLTVLGACETAMEKKLYGNIEPYLKDLNFSELLKHEFLMYAKLWPSVTPICGVWRSLLDLSQGRCKFKEDAQAVWSLYEIIVETPTVVRTITNNQFEDVINNLLEGLRGLTLTPDLGVIHASLLFWKTEFELAAASEKYGWKNTEPVHNLDPDQIPANRTIPQEFNASKSAVQAVAILAELSSDFDKVSNKKCLQNSLHIYQVFVQLFLHLSRDMEGLQLAHICCLIADCVADKEAYVRNAGTLLYHGGSYEGLQTVIDPAVAACPTLGRLGTAVTFLCDAAIYYKKTGSVGIAARMVQMAQEQVLTALENNPDINLDLAIGRLMEAQMELCPDSGLSTLSAVNGTQRHYLSIANTGTKWHARRLHALTLRVHSTAACERACAVARGVRVWRRARACASLAVAASSAPMRAKLYALITDTCCFDDAQIKIDNRLKHVLGLQPSNETQPYYATTPKMCPPFTPKAEIETMLESMVFKQSQTSPSLPCTSVPAFKSPDWFQHVNCKCYACLMPVCCILACHTSGLEASMYFRANEDDIARNYFNGVIQMLHTTEERFKTARRMFEKVYDEFIVETVMRKYWDWYRKVKIEILMELSFFELKSGYYDVADEHIVEIHELMQEIKVCPYTSNEIMNLMTCSARLKNTIKKPDTSLEAEFESLKLSPMKFVEPPKTPVTKPSEPPKLVTKVVKDEEIPKKRKVIKLKLDEEDENVFETKKTEFKVPEPVTSEHVLEVATPRTRSDPRVIVTQPSEEISTPNASDTTVYSTPISPNKFFTPITSVKTYSKKSLRHNIVKNLEKEFSTPKADKDNVKTQSKNLQVPSTSKASAKKTLKRATSPGKLCKEVRELPRTRRLRKSVNFSIDEDDKR